MNSLYQQLRNPQQQLPPPQQNQELLSNNNNILKQFLNSSNPSEFIQSMVMNNPQMKNVMQMYQTSGMSPKSFFYQYASQKGVDPNQFLNSLMN